MAISGQKAGFRTLVETGANLAGFSVFGLAWFLLACVSTIACLQAGMILARHGLKIDENNLLTE
jgi:hypothetical protein